MDHVSYNKQNSWGKRGFYFLLVILFAVTGLFIFKNVLFYSEYLLASNQLDENVLCSYSKNEELYTPIDGNAAICFNGYRVTANEVEIAFEKGLEEDTTFTLFNASRDCDQQQIEQKIVRKGYRNVKFYFENKDLDSIIVLAQSKDGSHFVNISGGTISLIEQKLNLVQKNKVYCSILVLIFISACILAFLVCKNKAREHKQINSRALRDSNLELLRIVCMILLVAHHFAVHGGLLKLDFSFPKYVGLVFLPTGKICFIAFIAISMYFLVDGKNKPQRFLRCWLEVVFYSVSLTIITWCLGGSVRFRDLISSFFVMTSNSHGFAASYLLFLLIYPFLLKATKGCKKMQARYLLVVLFGIQILSQIFKTWTGYTQPVFSELTLFVFCYVLSLNLKRYPIVQLEKKWFDVLVIILVYIYVYLINLVTYKGELNDITSVLYGITTDESSIFFIIGGYALFYLFKNIKIPYNKLINSIATCTFGVLLIHDHNFLRHLFWNEIVRTQTFFDSNYFIIWFGVTIMGVFLVCSVIDYLRQKLLEVRIINTKLYKKVVSKFEEIFI